MAENQLKFQEADRAIQHEALLQTELDTARAELGTARAELEGVRVEHTRVLNELKTQYEADLKAKDDLIKDKDAALNNLGAHFKTELEGAVRKAGADAVEAYKVSDEFQGFGLEYLERGIRTACRWVVLKFADVVTTIRPSLEAVQLDDPLIAEALAQVESQVHVEGTGTSEDQPLVVVDETPVIDVPSECAQ